MGGGERGLGRLGNAALSEFQVGVAECNTQLVADGALSRACIAASRKQVVQVREESRGRAHVLLDEDGGGLVLGCGRGACGRIHDVVDSRVHVLVFWSGCLIITS